MKYPLIGLVALAILAIGATCPAWDGFDADTTDLIEIIPDKIPDIGDTVEVRAYETQTVETCLVENVTRNRRTIEVVVRDPDGDRRTLVMETR